MPVLNGYDTSRQIRQSIFGELYSIIPIIAMTANAMLGEREKCLDAGWMITPLNPSILICLSQKLLSGY